MPLNTSVFLIYKLRQVGRLCEMIYIYNIILGKTEIMIHLDRFFFMITRIEHYYHI